jgi:solute carrier family 25 oxoglutarate transporter 11
MTFWEKMGWSLISGAIGSVIATPTDVALIRFQADNHMPADKRRNYKNVFDALGRMYKEEGARGMWTGATPTVFRAMSINCSQLVTYNHTKETLQSYLNTKDETVSIRLLSSALSGIAVTLCSLPFDNVKTKMMRMKKSSL